GPAGTAARPAVQRGRVPVPAWPAGTIGLASRFPLRARGRRCPRRHRLRAGRIDHGHVRRELQLARPGLVPAELPGDQRARALPPVLRRRADGRVPDRLGPAAHPGPGRPRPVRQAHLDLHPRSGRPAALLRRDGAAAKRSGLEGQPGLQRVLPRRQRRRDPPPPWRGPFGRRHSPAHWPGDRAVTAAAGPILTTLFLSFTFPSAPGPSWCSPTRTGPERAFTGKSSYLQVIFSQRSGSPVMIQVAPSGAASTTRGRDAPESAPRRLRLPPRPSPGRRGAL